MRTTLLPFGEVTYPKVKRKKGLSPIFRIIDREGDFLSLSPPFFTVFYVPQPFGIENLYQRTVELYGRLILLRI